MMVSFKGAHFVKEIILTCARWYVAYPLSYRQVEELMQERGVSVDHSTINRWVLKYAPQIEEAFHRHSHPEPECAQPVELVEAGDAGADDDGVEIHGRLS
jgi:transposase-like protein